MLKETCRFKKKKFETKFYIQLKRNTRYMPGDHFGHPGERMWQEQRWKWHLRRRKCVRTLGRTLNSGLFKQNLWERQVRMNEGMGAL